MRVLTCENKPNLFNAVRKLQEGFVSKSADKVQQKTMVQKLC